MGFKQWKQTFLKSKLLPLQDKNTGNPQHAHLCSKFIIRVLDYVMDKYQSNFNERDCRLSLYISTETNVASWWAAEADKWNKGLFLLSAREPSSAIFGVIQIQQ